MIIEMEILKELNLCSLSSFDTVHNYIDPYERMIRKGAISAKKGEIVSIPMNMRDGVLICRGKGNADWNNSAPHGAGRILARGKAKRELDFDDYKASMQGVYSTCVNEDTIDESPMVYKNMHEIIRLIEPTVDVLHIVRPILNIKAK